MPTVIYMTMGSLITRQKSGLRFSKCLKNLRFHTYGDFVEKYIKYAPLSLFCLTIGKLLIFQPTWEGAATALVAGLLAGAYEWKNQDKKIQEMEASQTKINKELDAKIELVSNVVNNHAKAIEDARSGVSALKLATQMRTQTPAAAPQRVF